MLGTGILKGLYITAKNLVGSYFTRDRMTTIQYPEERYKLPENFRIFPFLVYDEDTGKAPLDSLRCTACRMCEKECPPQCIYIIPERDAAGKLQKNPRVFDIDISVCMGCGICAEVCPFESIKMDHHFEVATKSRYEKLLLHREDLAKPNSYYQKIRPTDAAISDVGLAEEKRKAEAKAKAAAEAAAAKAAAAKAAAESAAASAGNDNPPAPANGEKAQ